MEALGGCQVSKSEVSRICAHLDEELAAFPERPLDDARYPYVWFDATHHKDVGIAYPSCGKLPY